MKESRNISKLKRERMLNFLEILKEKNSDDDSIRAINENQSLTSFNMRHCSLIGGNITGILFRLSCDNFGCAEPVMKSSNFMELITIATKSKIDLSVASNT